MQTNLVTVSDKWQVVIPKKVREKLKIKPKDKVLVASSGDKRIVVDIIGQDVIRKASGALKKYGYDKETLKRMLKEKKEELEYEDRKR
ncbi:AbrB/MazE/SpoVT family DNA-binding domain-containing protein [Patescibacteria group bacterium]|nr:AbrB/MazE/SpoVT family DNA-binding domain-containing protein [Patescibacteria group bacterium]